MMMMMMMIMYSSIYVIDTVMPEHELIVHQSYVIACQMHFRVRISIKFQPNSEGVSSWYNG